MLHLVFNSDRRLLFLPLTDKSAVVYRVRSKAVFIVVCIVPSAYSSHAAVHVNIVFIGVVGLAYIPVGVIELLSCDPVPVIGAGVSGKTDKIGHHCAL